MRDTKEHHPILFALFCSGVGLLLFNVLLLSVIYRILNLYPLDTKLMVIPNVVCLLAISIWLLCICAELRDENSIIDIPKYCWYTFWVIVLILLIILFSVTLIYEFFRP